MIRDIENIIYKLESAIDDLGNLSPNPYDLDELEEMLEHELFYPIERVVTKGLIMDVVREWIKKYDK